MVMQDISGKKMLLFLCYWLATDGTAAMMLEVNTAQKSNSRRERSDTKQTIFLV